MRLKRGSSSIIGRVARLVDRCILANTCVLHAADIAHKPLQFEESERSGDLCRRQTAASHHLVDVFRLPTERSEERLLLVGRRRRSSPEVELRSKPRPVSAMLLY